MFTGTAMIDNSGIQVTQIMGLRPQERPALRMLVSYVPYRSKQSFEHPFPLSPRILCCFTITKQNLQPLPSKPQFIYGV